MVSESEIFGGDEWEGNPPADPSEPSRERMVLPSGDPTVVTPREPSPFVRVLQVVLMGAGAVFILGLGGMFLLLLSVVARGASFDIEGPGLEKELVEPGPKEDTIGVVSLNGVIGGTSLYGEGRSGDFPSLLKTVAEAPNVKALIVEINSPGGSAALSDRIYHVLKGISKPKVALLGDMAASGGYYAAVGCDYIVAGPTTITGSIGVILESINVEGLMRSLGVEATVVKSGPHKDLLSPFRSPSEKEKEILQAAVNEIHRRFVEVVAEGRHLKPEDVLPLADGRIFSARAALENRLVDSIGYFEDAVAKAKELAGLSRARVIRLRRRENLWDLIFSARSGAFPAAAFLRRLHSGGARFIFAPGGG